MSWPQSSGCPPIPLGSCHLDPPNLYSSFTKAYRCYSCASSPSGLPHILESNLGPCLRSHKQPSYPLPQALLPLSCSRVHILAFGEQEQAMTGQQECTYPSGHTFTYSAEPSTPSTCHVPSLVVGLYSRVGGSQQVPIYPSTPTGAAV